MTANATIVDRVVLRLKTQPLGDLITEEDLHDIVKAAIPIAFMQSTFTGTGGYNDPRKETPAPIVQACKDALTTSVKAAVDEWMVAHADELALHWRKVFDEGIAQYVEHYRKGAIDMQIRTALGAAFGKVNEERQRQGLPMVVF